MANLATAAATHSSRQDGGNTKFAEGLPTRSVLENLLSGEHAHLAAMSGTRSETKPGREPTGVGLAHYGRRAERPSSAADVPDPGRSSLPETDPATKPSTQQTGREFASLVSAPFPYAWVEQR